VPQQKKPQNPSPKEKKSIKTSKSLIKRLPVYLRILDNLIRRDVEIISSRVLSEETGFTAEQIRKDLATFGAFGTRGTGYNTSYLREKLLRITGLDKQIRIVVVGSGHLGKALTRYNILKNPYVEIAGIFDASPNEQDTEILGLIVQSMENLPHMIKEQNLKVAMITVPAEVAQAVVDLLVENGITAILNFAPTKLRAPDGVHIHNADLTIELQSMIYYTLERERSNPQN